MNSILIAPSVLAADFSRLGEEIEAVASAGADYIHIDVMDGHFVPALTIGPAVVKSVRNRTDLPFDVHLMVSSPDRYVDSFAEAGADILTVHPESGPHLHGTLQSVRAAGLKAGVALNPATPLSMIEPVLEDIDMILVMSVNPGAGGQKFISSQLSKIGQARQLIDSAGLDIALEVDGGINPLTAPEVIAAGARILVAGSAVFTGDPARYGTNIDALRGSRRTI